MSSNLSVCLDQHSIALRDTESCAYVTGFIKIETDLANFKLPSWARIQLQGHEKIDNITHSILHDTYQLSSRPHDWICDHSDSIYYKLPFRLEVPKDIPSSFQMERYQEKENEKFNDNNDDGIYYTIKATVSGLNQSAREIVHFYRTSDSALIPRRLLWGIAKHATTWHYEIDLPRQLDGAGKPDTMTIRLKSRQRTNRRNIESCLVGCQVIQLVQISDRQDQYDTLMSDTQLLTSPHTSWQYPCQISLEYHSDPIPSAASQRITISHFIRITLSFGNLTGSTCQCEAIEFPVTVTGVPSPKRCVTTRSISRSNSISSSINEVASQDSAVDLLPSPSFKSIYSL
ncbi:hypothetical protein K501DRAFT_333050 [Backusella circina FSU 941]|nr:hypothetical protein K501DRAFT_333050 [Backusella circina FSU 941]